MASATLDYSALLKDLPPGAWVAISEEKNAVIAYDAEIRSVVAKAKEHGEDLPLIVRVPSQPVCLIL
jgi:hypothetical protein